MAHNPEDVRQAAKAAGKKQSSGTGVAAASAAAGPRQEVHRQKLARLKARKAHAGQFFETPLVVATSFDYILSANPGQRRSLNRSRAALKAKIGLGPDHEWMSRLHFGPGKVLTYTIAPLLLPLQASSNRASTAYRRRLLEAINETVMPTIHQRVFDQLSSVAVGGASEQVRKQMAHLGKSMTASVFIATANKAIRDSFVHEGACRALAQDYSAQMAAVSETVEGLDRYEGYIVRFDGDQVLLALEKGGNLQFVWEDRGLLQPFGLEQEGEAIVVYEQRYAPGQTSRVVYGGVEEVSLSEDELREEERQINERFMSLDEMSFPSY